MVFIMLTRGLRTKMTKFTSNCWGASSFWVSTSVCESLLTAKKLNFYHIFTWASRAYDFQAFFIVFDHVNICASKACVRWSKYSTLTVIIFLFSDRCSLVVTASTKKRKKETDQNQSLPLTRYQKANLFSLILVMSL